VHFRRMLSIESEKSSLKKASLKVESEKKLTRSNLAGSQIFIDLGQMLTFDLGLYKYVGRGRVGVE